MLFQYSPKLMNVFPKTVGGIIHLQQAKNDPTSNVLKEKYLAEQQLVLQQLGEGPVGELPSINAWRQTFRQFGVNPTKTRCAPEALLRRLTKQGDIPSINTLVDIGNLVSIRYAMPVAIFDLRDVQGTVTVGFSEGKERFTELGSTQPIHPDPGEVVFADEADMVLARRWCWRQSAESAARADTQNALICIEAQHESGNEDARKGMADLLALLTEHVGGEHRSALLSAEDAITF